MMDPLEEVILTHQLSLTKCEKEKEKIKESLKKNPDKSWYVICNQAMCHNNPDESHVREFINECPDINKTNFGYQLPPLFKVVPNMNDHKITKILMDDGADLYKDCGRSVSMVVTCKGCRNKVYCKSKNVIDAAVRRGFDFKKTDLEGNTIFHFEKCKYLMGLAGTYGVSIEAVNNRGLTPLKDAILKKEADKVSSLLSLGANANYLKFVLSTLTKDYDEVVGDIIDMLLYHGEDIRFLLDENVIIVSRLKHNRFICRYGKKLVRYFLLFVDEDIFLRDCSKSKHLFHHTNEDSLTKFIFNCKLELDEMRSALIKDDLTFYDFCIKKRFYQSEFLDIPFDAYRYSDEQIQEAFPIYSDLIVTRVHDNKRKRRENFLVNIMLGRIVVQPNLFSDDCAEVCLNYDCLFYICKYLNCESLYNLFLVTVDD